MGPSVTFFGTGGPRRDPTRRSTAILPRTGGPGPTSRKSETTANPETWIAAAGNARPCSIGLTTAGSSEVSSVPRRPVIR
jgi:hypothetical protein